MATKKPAKKKVVKKTSSKAKRPTGMAKAKAKRPTAKKAAPKKKVTKKK